MTTESTEAVCYANVNYAFAGASFTLSTESVSVTTSMGSEYFVQASMAEPSLIQTARAAEDYADIIESDRAMAEARVKGTKPWRQLKKELSL